MNTPAREIPVYLFTGFLEAGKTKFIQETFEDPRFNNGENTLYSFVRKALKNTIRRASRVIWVRFMR